MRLLIQFQELLSRNPNTFVFRFLDNTTQLSNTVFAGANTTETVGPANPNLIGSAISTVGGTDGTLRVLEWRRNSPSTITGTPVRDSDIFRKANNSVSIF